MVKGSKECQDTSTAKRCFTCVNCDACIKDVSRAFAELVMKDLNIGEA